MNEQIKISIIVPNLLLKKNWEVKILYSLLNNPYLSTNIVIINQQKNNQSKLNISFILIKLLNFVEKKFSKIKLTKEKNELQKKFKKIKIQSIQKKTNYQEDSLENLLKKNDSNLILNLCKNSININKLSSWPEYGIWSFLNISEDNQSLIDQFNNFYNEIEVYKGRILINFKDNIFEEMIINVNRFKSFFQTKEYASIKMCNFIISEINKIRLNKFTSINKDRKKIELPKLNQTKELSIINSLLNYCLSTYSKIFFNKFFSKVFLLDRIEDYKWYLALTNSADENIDLSRLKIQKSKNNEFWADPFLYNHQKKNYVFFENYKFKDQKGIISVGEIIDDKITCVKDIIKCNYHLSYPYVYEYQGKIYMMPETHQSKRLEIWVATCFPYEWKIFKTLFNGKKLADSSIIYYNNSYWLFTNIEDDHYNDFATALSIFKIDSPLLNTIQPHKYNPVIVGTKNSRNAGSIFIDKKGNFIRPSQAYTAGVYGKYINLSKITELDINTYKEEIISTIMPSKKLKIKGVHHINKFGDKYVLDIFKRK